jgi:hypothetical protein
MNIQEAILQEAERKAGNESIDALKERFGLGEENSQRQETYLPAGGVVGSHARASIRRRSSKPTWVGLGYLHAPQFLVQTLKLDDPASPRSHIF